MEQVRFLRRWVLIALVYFVGALALGVFMAATHDMRLKGVHVHLHLLGWVSLSLTAFVYRLFPAATATRCARLHFWLYNLALPVMMAGLAGLLLGRPAFEPLVALGSVAVLASALLFAVAIFRQAGASTFRRSRLAPLDPLADAALPRGFNPRPRPGAAHR